MRRLWDRPLFCCGFRPFFLLTALHAVWMLVAWGLMLAGWLPMPRLPGGPVLWHMHEMLFGFGMAAVAGFLLTAVPEFTNTRPLQYARLALLAGLWLSARLSMLFSDTLGIMLAALPQLAFLLLLTWQVIPPLWRDPGRRHLSFAVVLLLLGLLETGFFVDLAMGGPAWRWIHAATGAMMVLIIVALSRISMRIVNDELAAAGEREIEYRARPPRRNMAIFCITLYSVVEFALPGNTVGGWIALAAAAAVLNLLNDWHIGRPLFRRKILMLYVIYPLMAAGYVLIGLSLFDSGLSPSSGRHMLLVGAMGISVLLVMVIAGNAHSGRKWDTRQWVLFAVMLLFCSAVLRAAAGFHPVHSLPLWMIAALMWTVAFVLYLYYSWPNLLKPRPDTGAGCDEYT